MMPTEIDSIPETEEAPRRWSEPNNLRASLCLDHAPDPEVADLQISSDGKRPYIFVYVDKSLSLWARDPAQFRRLATALTDAADRLEWALANLAEPNEAAADDAPEPDIMPALDLSLDVNNPQEG